MTRLIAIAFLVALAFFLFRYRTNEKVQKGVVIAVVSAFIIYTVTLVVTELLR
ncbi:hypothetical protein [Vibrio hangzhouensis]|uniref:Uncharacterized protein n=1 Tax=Vibrio hangzhouensis TaxID=462991 RepID=A0A1H5W9T5_9VIBR|nr:hypothetical protein [Vibrio hangzhouensis]MBY6196794.1 hypothetical protein [Vibrio hangzhouensis]SEF95567.1 hypothetical protein SAMN04488244_105168 [Vibrio hangzhouensis]